MSTEGSNGSLRWGRDSTPVPAAACRRPKAGIATPSCRCTIDGNHEELHLYLGPPSQAPQHTHTHTHTHAHTHTSWLWSLTLSMLVTPRRDRQPAPRLRCGHGAAGARSAGSAARRSRARAACAHHWRRQASHFSDPWRLLRSGAGLRMRSRPKETRGADGHEATRPAHFATVSVTQP